MSSPVRRNPCTKCRRLTKRQSKVCQECSPTTAKRPESPCKTCRKRTTSKNGICKACEPTWMKQGPITYAHAVYAETPGDWVNVQGVQRWVPRSEAG